MGISLQTSFTAGGTMSAAIADDLDALAESLWLRNDDGPTRGRAGTTVNYQGERNYGNVDDLEEFCQDNDIPYIVSWEGAGGDHDAGINRWSPGDAQVSTPVATLDFLKDMATKSSSAADAITALEVFTIGVLPPIVITP
jgi:hypothetical protein